MQSNKFPNLKALPKSGDASGLHEMVAALVHHCENSEMRIEVASDQIDQLFDELANSKIEASTVRNFVWSQFSFARRYLKTAKEQSNWLALNVSDVAAQAKREAFESQLDNRPGHEMTDRERFVAKFAIELQFDALSKRLKQIDEDGAYQPDEERLERFTELADRLSELEAPVGYNELMEMQSETLAERERHYADEVKRCRAELERLQAVRILRKARRPTIAA